MQPGGEKTAETAGHKPQSLAPRRQHKPLRPDKLLILLFFALMVFLAVKDQVPAVNDWFQRTLHPAQWRAAEACRRGAIEAAAHPSYARIIERGKISATTDGFFLENVIIGEMGNDGAEIHYTFHCYTDKDANLIKTHKDRGE